MAPVSENEPGRPDSSADTGADTGADHGRESRPDPGEDTAPLWSAQEQPAGTPPQEQWQGDAGDQGYGYPGQPWGDPGYAGGYPGYGSGGYDNAWGQPTQQLPYQGWYDPAPPRQRGHLPGWVWPVVGSVALVVGLLGGAVGALLVPDGSGPVVSSLGGDDSAPAPLEPENGSVAAVAEALLPSTVQILTRGGSGPAGAATGSGFVVDRRGHVITNNHVVAGAAEDGRIQVIDHRGRRHTATIVGRSPVYDIAVLSVKGTRGLQPAALGSSRSMNVGETVVAIGSPLGLGSTVTSGIVSALDRPVTTGDAESSSYINAVQTDAAINPGNSGGPLVNLRGEVVGVNSAIATMGAFAGDGGNIGVGFAIPMEQVDVTATQILRTGEAEYPVIGAEVDTRGRKNGAEIVVVPGGTPAARAGLEEGDVVVAVEDRAVADGIGLIVAIRSHQPGETIEMTVRRDGRERQVEVTLDAKVG